MRIAHLILAHHQAQHLGALVDQLDDGNARLRLKKFKYVEMLALCGTTRACGTLKACGTLNKGAVGDQPDPALLR